MYLSSNPSSLDVLFFQLYFCIPLFPYFQTDTASIFLRYFVPPLYFFQLLPHSTHEYKLSQVFLQLNFP